MRIRSINRAGELHSSKSIYLQGVFSVVVLTRTAQMNRHLLMWNVRRDYVFTFCFSFFNRFVVCFFSWFMNLQNSRYIFIMIMKMFASFQAKNGIFFWLQARSILRIPHANLKFSKERSFRFDKRAFIKSVFNKHYHMN